jgi:hypothetical protein
MSDHHLSRGIPIFLALAVLFFAGACNTTTSLQRQPIPEPPPPNPILYSSPGESLVHAIAQYEKEVFCTKGNGSKGAPMICVENPSRNPQRYLDDGSGKPDPYLVQVWDVQGENGIPTSRPVIVHWFTKRPAELEIRFRDGADGPCVTNLVCRGGHCSATVRPLVDGTPRYCSYTVSVGGRPARSKSPGMSVIPCCW